MGMFRSVKYSHAYPVASRGQLRVNHGDPSWVWMTEDTASDLSDLNPAQHIVRCLPF